MANIIINLKFTLDTNIFVIMIYRKLQEAESNGKLLMKGMHTLDTDSRMDTLVLTNLTIKLIFSIYRVK
jgi:hypothetical protein